MTQSREGGGEVIFDMSRVGDGIKLDGYSPIIVLIISRELPAIMRLFLLKAKYQIQGQT